MKKTTRIILIIICSLFIILSAAGVIWAFANKFSNKAYADYEDLTSDNVVNFNQLVPNTYINGTINDSVQIINTRIANSGDKLYIRFNSSNTSYFNFYDDKNLVFQVSGTNIDNIYTCSSYISRVYHYSSGTSTMSNFNIYNLSTMFGVGNEPNIVQAKDYFTAEYYSYTTGTPLPFSIDYLQGYQQGVIDFQNSLKTTFNNDVIGTMSFAANISGIESTIAYNSGYGAYLVDGIAGIHFGNAITSQIEFYIEFFLTNYSGGLYFVVFNYSNGTLIPISSDEIIQGTANSNPYVKSIFNVNNLDTLYFGVFDSTQQFNNNTKVSGYFFKSELTIYTIDIAALITQAIGQTEANYMEGGAGYEMIYNEGFYAGAAHGNATLETMDYIGAAFTGIGSILQIELLPGIPFSLFILLPLMFGLITFVVKLSKGGS